MSEITAEYFKEKTGQGPVDDDLERCNCQYAGRVGHFCCGWCTYHEKPIFMCGCRVYLKAQGPEGE